MNVFFHVLSGTAVAATAARKLPPHTPIRPYLSRCAAVFLLGILTHGILDVAPHQYPLRTVPDVFISISCIGVCLVWIRPNLVPLFGASLLGSILPDLVDLGPQLLNRFAGTALPIPKSKIFPWHRPEFSGSIHDGSRAALSTSSHLLVVSVFAVAVLYCRKSITRN